MTWKVNKYYYNSDTPTYEVAPYNFIGHLRCCWKWYGFNGLKWCYLSKRKAEQVATKLNKQYI